MSLFHRGFTALEPYTTPAKPGRIYPQQIPEQRTDVLLQIAFAEAIDNALEANQKPATLSIYLGQLIIDAIQRKPVAEVYDPIGMYSTLVEKDPATLRVLHNTFLTADTF
jgi:hypothetical protein